MQVNFAGTRQFGKALPHHRDAELNNTRQRENAYAFAGKLLAQGEEQVQIVDNDTTYVVRWAKDVQPETDSVVLSSSRLPLPPEEPKYLL